MSNPPVLPTELSQLAQAAGNPFDCIHCGKELCNDLGWCNDYTTMAMAAKKVTPDQLVQAIAVHIDGWRSATFGWQGDPDPVVTERNRTAAIEAHAAECLRRIQATVAKLTRGK